MTSHALPASRRSLETWTLWSLLATLALGLLVVYPPLSLPATTTKTFLLAIGTVVTVVLYIIARLTKGNIILPPVTLLAALWLPAIAYAVSAAFSGVPFVTALWGTALEPDTLGVMLMLALLGTLTALVVRRTEQYAFIAYTAAGLFMFVTFLHLVTLLLGQVIPSTVAPSFSLLGSFEDLALFLGLGVTGALIAYRFLDLTRQGRRLLIATTIAALVLIAVANSAFVWILLALVSLGLFIESAMMRKQFVDDEDLEEVAFVEERAVASQVGRHSIALALPVLVAAVFFLVGSNLGGALAEAAGVNVLSVSPSWGATLNVAQKTYEHSALLGTGPGSFGVEWLKHRDPSLNSTVFWNVDFNSGIGLVPTSFVTTGILGALAWLCFFGLFIVLGIRMLIARTPGDTLARTVAILAFVATLYLFAAAVFRLPNTVLFALAFACAGLFVSTMRYAEGAGQRGVVFARSPRVGFVIVFVLTLLLFVSIVTAYSLVGRYLSTVALASASQAFNRGELSSTESGIERSLTFAPTATAYQAQANVAIVRLSEIAASTTMPTAAAQQAFQSTLSAGINAALTSTRLAPNNYQNWLTLGNLYAQAVPLGVTGAYDSAKTAYEKAQELHPTSPEIRFIIAQLNIAQKNYPAAEDNLKSAIALKQDYTNAIFLLSQLQVQTGKVKEALDTALAAAYFAPGNANILFQVGVLRAAQGDYAGAVEALTATVNANGEYANARYFLAAVYAKQNNFKASLGELQEIAKFSAENATAVAPLVAALEAGKNPFPANLLTINPPAAQPATTPAAQ